MLTSVKASKSKIEEGKEGKYDKIIHQVHKVKYV